MRFNYNPKFGDTTETKRKFALFPTRVFNKHTKDFHTVWFEHYYMYKSYEMKRVATKFFTVVRYPTWVKNKFVEK